MANKLLTSIGTRLGIPRSNVDSPDASAAGRETSSIFRRRQFRLLSMLLLVCLGALIVRFVVVPTMRTRARDTLLKRIATAGGQWAEIQGRAPDKRLFLRGKAIDDELISDLAYQIQSFPELTQLDLFQTRVTDKGWESITLARGKIKHMVVLENEISEKTIDETQRRRTDLLIERRIPDPIASRLAIAPIPPGAIVAVLADSGAVLTGSGDGRMHRVDLARQHARQTFKLHDNWLFDLALSPDGAYLASAGGDNRLAIWKYPEMQLACDVVAHDDDLHGVAWIDNAHLATVGDDCLLRTWQMTSNKESIAPGNYKLTLLQSRQEHHGSIPRIRISEDRKTLITASRDDQLLVWRVESGSKVELLGELVGHNDDCMDVRIGPNNKFVISVAYDGKLIRWDLSTFGMIDEHQLDQGRLFCLEVDWQSGIAWVGTKSGIVEFDWESEELKVRNDQPFVSRIVATNGNLISSDGFGSLFSRRSSSNLEPSHRITFYESPFDVYSDEYFELFETDVKSRLTYHSIGPEVPLQVLQVTE